MKHCFRVFAAIVALSACAPQTSETKIETPDYKAEIERALSIFDTTGMVVSVMVDGKVDYIGAFGTAEEGTGRPVTEETLFPISSISKAFTTTALAIMVDRGVLNWDDPVQNYIPEFSMYDPWVSEHFTIRDAVTHRSGLPLGAGDLLFWPDGEPSPGDIIAALPHLKPSAGFRSKFAYDNLLYVVAGEVLARVSGKTWAEFVTDEILTPVGMTSCAADRTRIKDGQAVVTGHERAAGAKSGTPVDERILFAPSIAAMGGIYCPAGDIMTWAKVWLDNGVKADGTRLVSEQQMQELLRGVTPLSPRSQLRKADVTKQTLYALGWFVQDFEGTLMLTHSGGAPGVISNFIVLPEKNIAIFASSNDYRAAPHAITYQLADGLVNGQGFDFIAEWGAGFVQSQKSALEKLADAYGPNENALPPTLDLSAYVGIYRDAWYGDVNILKNTDGLFIDMGRSEILDGPLQPYDGDTFVAVWPDRSLKADAFVTFTVHDNIVQGMKIKAVSEITDFSFDFHDLDLVKLGSEH